MLSKFKKNMETGISSLHEEAVNKMNKFDVKLNKLENNIGEIDNYIKKNNKRKLDVANNQYSNLLLEYNKSKNELMEIKGKLNKAKDNINTDKIEEIEKEIKYKNDEVINLENKLSKKNKYIKDLEKSIQREIKKELSSSSLSTSSLKSVVDKENYPDMPFLETEEEAAENIADINEHRKKNKEDDTDSEYDRYGFIKYGIHKDTDTFYDIKNFYIAGKK